MNYDYLLNLHTAHNDEFRPHLRLPFLIGDFTYATDSRSLIRIQNSKLDFKYSENDKAPQPSSMFEKDTSKLFVFDTSRLSLAVAKAKMVFLGKICQQCSGKGKVTCNSCNYSHECIECEGEGHMANEQDFRIAIDSDIIAIKIAGKYFKPFILERLLISAFALKADTITMALEEKETTASLFMVGDIEMIMMACIISKEDNPDIVEI